jgi:hypothetical protein
MPAGMGELYRGYIQRGIGGANAANYGMAARAQALQGAQSIGASMAGVSPALAARQAQQVAAQQAAGIAAQQAQMQAQEQAQAAQMAQAQEQADRQQVQQYIGMGLQAAGSATSMLMSDEDAKRELGGGAEATDQLVESLEPERFQYRPGTGQPGDVRIGVMAQDVEHGGPMGREMVGRMPNGMRGLDKDRAISALLASVGRLGQRLESLERGGKR